MKQQAMYSVEDIKEKIASGKRLLLAGDEKVLTMLPQGNWIGGTCAYFMSDTGGVCTQTEIWAVELPEYILNADIKIYDSVSVSNVYTDMPDNGFCFIIIPAMSKTHFSFALNSPDYKSFGTSPLIGWISGIHLNEAGKAIPKIFNGKTGEVLEDGAVVMHITLPENKAADTGILNIFEPGKGDVITFPEDGFSATDAFINGERMNFTEYLLKNKVDIETPLVADYYGIMVNVSFRSIDEKNKTTRFYAPVFKHIEYRLAAPVKDYVSEFISHIPDSTEGKIIFSCNCVLNYLYSELEGRQTKGFTGPVTFGEIAYQLLNQTLTYVVISDISND
jgi:hypothetical protein